MGGEESTPPNKVPTSWGIDANALNELLRRARMVENGAELVAWLKSLVGAPGFIVEDYVVFDKLDHSAAAWAALARGIPFAFPAQ